MSPPTRIPVREVDLPRGARTIRSLHAPVRLGELRFDPIDEAVELIARIDKRLAYFEAMMDQVDDEGRPVRIPNQAYNELLSLRQKATNDLMRYGYSRVSEAVPESTKEMPVFNVTLNMPKTDNG